MCRPIFSMFFVLTTFIPLSEHYVKITRTLVARSRSTCYIVAIQKGNGGDVGVKWN